MPSTRLADCINPLAVAYVQILNAYREAHPGHDLLLTCTYRSAEEQWDLYKKGRVLKGDVWVVDADLQTSIVTNIDGRTKKSKHNSQPAAALDFCVVIGGKISWDPREYEPVGVLARDQGLVWGGDWVTLKDYPHLELKGSP